MPHPWVSLLGAIALTAGVAPLAAIADDHSTAAIADATPFLRPPTTCPDEVPVLLQGLLRDLPSYANRVARRTLGTTPDDTGFGTVLIAGRAELEPLPLEELAFTNPPDDATQQVFFTTLERRYTDTTAVALEKYHWLFLVPAPDGWRLTLMFSRTAPDDQESRPPTPPQESSDGIMGQAVQLWLRDCRAGAVYPIGEVDSDITER
jgi:hypothetical protein